MKYAMVLMTGLMIGLPACNETPTDPNFEIVCTGEYTYAQLYYFRRIGGPVMNVEGVNSFGADFEAGCIEVGMLSRDVIPQAEAKLIELEVPLDAVTFYYANPVALAEER